MLIKCFFPQPRIASLPFKLKFKITANLYAVAIYIMEQIDACHRCVFDVNFGC